MDVAQLLQSIESWSVAAAIRNSLYIFPFLESVHVFALAMVYGTIAIVDLRLLGFASSKRSFQRMASEILKWTWLAFVLSLITGALMFTTNASVYYHNTFFRVKMLFLLMSGINMMIFEWTTLRQVHTWDKGSAPTSGKIAAVLSLVLWTGTIFVGRWIGFTTTQAQFKEIESTEPEINFDELFGGDTPQSTPPATK